MPPPCKVCSSRRTEYEKLRDEGKSFRELSRIAKERFNEDIGFTSFARHFSPLHKTKEQKPTFVPSNKRTWGWADASGGSSEGSMQTIDELRG